MAAWTGHEHGVLPSKLDHYPTEMLLYPRNRPCLHLLAKEIFTSFISTMTATLLDLLLRAHTHKLTHTHTHTTHLANVKVAHGT
jgi:hypothetical protein